MIDKLPSFSDGYFVNKPFPYYIHDNFFSADFLSEINRYWPSLESFRNSPGTNLGSYNMQSLAMGNSQSWVGLQKIEYDFWKEFFDYSIVEILRFIAPKFSDHIFSVYSNALDELLIGGFNIAQAVGPLNKRTIHNHYHHNPDWVLTCLFYIDDLTEERGTSLLLPLDDELDEISDRGIDVIVDALTGGHEHRDSDKFRFVDTISFKRNRLFVFFESAKSYHGRKNYEHLGHMGMRRMMNIHVGVPQHLMPNVYGEELSEIQRQFCEGDAKGGALKWVAQNIQNVESTSSGSGAEIVNRLQRITVSNNFEIPKWKNC